MDHDALNMSVRKYLKQLGVTSQREIEAAVTTAAANGSLPKTGTVTIRSVVSIPEIGLEHVIDGEISTKQ